MRTTFNPMLVLSYALLVVGLSCSVLTGAGSTSEPAATVPPTLAPTLEPTLVVPAPQQPATEASNELSPSQPLNERFYTQDFDEALTKWSYVLTGGKQDDFSLKVLDGYLVFDEKGRDIWAYALYDEYLYSDVALDVRVENMGSNSYQVNLICRYDEHEGWWEFNIKNGLYQIRYGKWDNNKITASYTRIANGASSFWKNGQVVNDIGVKCLDTGLSISINGFEETQSAKDDRHFLLKGQIGIGISSFNDPTVLVRYDWVKIGEK